MQLHELALHCRHLAQAVNTQALAKACNYIALHRRITKGEVKSARGPTGELSYIPQRNAFADCLAMHCQILHSTCQIYTRMVSLVIGVRSCSCVSSSSQSDLHLLAHVRAMRLGNAFLTST